MDSDAITELYNTYSRQVYLYTLSLCGDSHIAEDIMQEAFVKAVFSLEYSHENVKAWLFRVCRNLWIDYLRKNKHIAHIGIENMDMEDPSSNFLHDIIKTEESRELFKAIKSMPRSLREVLILYYYLEIPQSKIAEILNVSNGAVRTLLYRARNKLRTMMEGNV